MSGAAERIIGEMGFRSIERLFPFHDVALGLGLTMTLIPPAPELSERWVLQPFVKGRSHRESFFNMDIIPGRCVAFGVFDALEGTGRLVVMLEVRHSKRDDTSSERAALKQRIRELVLTKLNANVSDIQFVPVRTLKKSTSGKLSRPRNRARYLCDRDHERDAIGTRLGAQP